MKHRGRQVSDALMGGALEVLLDCLTDVWDKTAHALRTTGGGGLPSGSCQQIGYVDNTTGGPAVAMLDDILQVLGGASTSVNVTLVVRRAGGNVNIQTRTPWVTIKAAIDAAASEPWLLWYQTEKSTDDLRYVRVSDIERVEAVGDPASGTAVMWTRWITGSGQPVTSSLNGVTSSIRAACDRFAERVRARRMAREREAMDEHEGTPPAHGKGVLVAYPPDVVVNVQQLYNPPRVTVTLASGDSFTVPGLKLVTSAWVDVVEANGAPTK